jgi:hypothetical protein
VSIRLIAIHLQDSEDCRHRTLILAGHETTASTITWTLYELARHPEFQNKVREEIKATRAHAAQRGDDELSVADLDSMKYLLALMKVRPDGSYHVPVYRRSLILIPACPMYRRHSDTIPLPPSSVARRDAMT